MYQSTYEFYQEGRWRHEWLKELVRPVTVGLSSGLATSRSRGCVVSVQLQSNKLSFSTCDPSIGRDFFCESIRFSQAEPCISSLGRYFFRGSFLA